MASRDKKAWKRKPIERRVRDLDTGKVYKDARHAAKGAGIPFATNAIEMYLSNKWDMNNVFGHHFDYVD